MHKRLCRNRQPHGLERQAVSASATFTSFAYYGHSLLCLGQSPGWSDAGVDAWRWATFLGKELEILLHLSSGPIQERVGKGRRQLVLAENIFKSGPTGDKLFPSPFLNRP